MSSQNTNVVLTRGLQCPHCKLLGEPGDAACVNGDFDFPADHPVVGLNEEGEIIEVNGAPVSVTKGAAPPVVASVSDPAAATANTAVATTAPAATTATTTATRTCWLELRVDTSPRDGRPPEGDADYDAPPTWAPFRYELTAAMVRFGRAPLIPGALTIEGDNVVGRVHGDLRRLSSGSYELENLSRNGTFVRSVSKLLKENERYILAPGDELELGDWVTATYHEETVA